MGIAALAALGSLLACTLFVRPGGLDCRVSCDQMRYPFGYLFLVGNVIKWPLTTVLPHFLEDASKEN